MIAQPVPGVLASLSLTILLSSLGTSIANVALPTLARAFQASFHEVQWVVLAYLLAITTLIVSVGRLGDLIGRRRLLLAGIFVFIGASALGGAAPTLGLLIAARAAQGLGGAVMMALTLAFVGETVPPAQTGRAMGLLGTMSAVGTAVGPTLGGLLIARFGWPAVFLINLPLGILAAFLAHRYLPGDGPTDGRVVFDHRGTLLLVLTLAAYALALTLGRGSFGILNGALLVAAGLGIGLFGMAEGRAKSPLISLTLFRQPALRAGLVMSGLVSTVMMATLVVGPFYLSRALGLDAAAVGLALSVGPLVAALAGLPAGRGVDRLGAPKATAVGLVGMALGSSMLSMVRPGVSGYLAPIMVMTAGYALFQTANNSAVMKDIAPDQRGLVSGLLNLSRNLGLLTGASLMGAIFAQASATTDISTASPEAVATGLRTTFAVATVLIVIALAQGRGQRGGEVDEQARPDQQERQTVGRGEGLPVVEGQEKLEARGDVLEHAQSSQGESPGGLGEAQQGESRHRPGSYEQQLRDQVDLEQAQLAAAGGPAEVDQPQGRQNQRLQVHPLHRRQGGQSAGHSVEAKGESQGQGDPQIRGCSRQQHQGSGSCQAYRQALALAQAFPEKQGPDGHAAEGR